MQQNITLQYFYLSTHTYYTTSHSGWNDTIIFILFTGQHTSAEIVYTCTTLIKNMMNMTVMRDHEKNSDDFNEIVVTQMISLDNMYNAGCSYWSIFLRHDRSLRHTSPCSSIFSCQIHFFFQLLFFPLLTKLNRNWIYWYLY